MEASSDNNDPCDNKKMEAPARAMNSNTLAKRNAFMIQMNILDNEPTVRTYTEYY